VVGDNPTFPVMVDAPPASVIWEYARIAKLEAEPRSTVVGIAVALWCRKMAAATIRANLGNEVIFILNMLVA
jgi:hypothetical protein